MVRCGVIQDFCHGSRRKKLKEEHKETIVDDQRDMDTDKAADVAVQTEYMCRELSFENHIVTDLRLLCQKIERQDAYLREEYGGLFKGRLYFTSSEKTR